MRSLYTTWPSIEEEVESMLSTLEDSQLERPAVLYQESPWGFAYQKAFESQLKNKNKNVVLSRPQGFGFHDFRSEVTRLKSVKPSMVLVAHTGATIVSFLKQAQVMNFKKGIFYAPSDAEDVSILTAAKGNADGLSVFSTESKEETEGRKKFNVAYSSKYNITPTPLSRHAYDQVKLLTYAFKECNKEIDCVKNYLSNLKDFDGASGKFSMKESRLAARKINHKVAEGNQFIFR